MREGATAIEFNKVPLLGEGDPYLKVDALLKKVWDVPG